VATGNGTSPARFTPKVERQEKNPTTNTELLEAKPAQVQRTTTNGQQAPVCATVDPKTRAGRAGRRRRRVLCDRPREGNQHSTTYTFEEVARARADAVTRRGPEEQEKHDPSANA